MKGLFEIQVDEKYIISQLQNGVQQNPYYSSDLDAYALNMSKRGWKLWNGDGNMHCEAKELSLSEFFLIMSLDGGDVKNFPLLVKIHEDYKNELVTDGLPQRLVVDEEGNTVVPNQVKTWWEWFNPTENYPTQVHEDGCRYYLSYAPIKGNDYLTAQELLILHNSENIELVESRPVIEEDII